MPRGTISRISTELDNEIRKFHTMLQNDGHQDISLVETSRIMAKIFKEMEKKQREESERLFIEH